MGNQTQLDRYKKLISFIEENFKEDINIEKVESVCHYSYRNINRIFEAIHHETIGRYIKRLRLEKAAQFLKYASIPVAEIAYEVGFEDRAAFSKAFKSKYGCSPLAFRDNNVLFQEEIRNSVTPEINGERQKLIFEIEFLPDFDYIFLEYRGDYRNTDAIDKIWQKLEDYSLKNNLLHDNSIFLTEIIDDEKISDHINSRYNSAFILEEPIDFVPEGLFRTNTHKRQKYARFEHYGSYEDCYDFYNEIYAFWIMDVGLELEDQPTLEFYPEYDLSNATDEVLTHIYIPIA